MNGTQGLRESLSATSHPSRSTSPPLRPVFRGRRVQIDGPLVAVSPREAVQQRLFLGEAEGDLVNRPSRSDKVGKEGLSGITCPVTCQSRVAPPPKSGLQAQCGGGLENPWVGTERCVPLNASADCLHLALEHRHVHRFHPTLSDAVSDPDRGSARRPLPAGPGSLLGSLHQASPQRIPLDIPRLCDKRWPGYYPGSARGSID